MDRNKKVREELFETKKEQLKESTVWFPYPGFIAFGMILIFICQLYGLNPRFGNPASTIYFDSKPAPDGGIWISASTDKGNIVITTQDQSVFRLLASGKANPGYQNFVQYLKDKTASISLSAGLAKKIQSMESKVIISVDEHLKYLHIKPILIAMAETGIGKYAFETKMKLRNEPHSGYDE